MTSTTASLRVAVCGLTAGALLGLTDSARAALLSYDPFAYGDPAVPAAGEYALGDENAGTNLLAGQNPTIGPTAFYAGGWELGVDQNNQAVKALPSLSYPNFQPGVGGIQQETLQFDCCSVGRTGRELAVSLGTARESRTIYESFLIDFGTQGTDTPGDFGKRGHELWSGGVEDSLLAVELFVNHFTGVTALSLAVTTFSGTQTVAVDPGGLDLDTLAGTHLVVMKYEFDSSLPDVVSVFLDPTNSIEPVTPSAQISVANSDLVITHHGAFSQFTFSGTGHEAGAIDEIRWGDTFLDVTPFIPEPASTSLLGIGLAFLLGTRRRCS